MSYKVSVAILLISCVGCGDANSSWICDETKGLNQMADLMAKITDISSYEATKPSLKSLYEAQKKRREQLFSNPSAEKRRKLWEAMQARPDYPKYEEAAKRYQEQRDRLSRLPDVWLRFGRELILPSHNAKDPFDEDE